MDRADVIKSWKQLQECFALGGLLATHLPLDLRPSIISYFKAIGTINPNCKFKSEFKLPKSPYAVLINPQGELVLAHFYEQKLQIYSREGKFLRCFGSGFGGPTDLRYDTQGNLLVLEHTHNRVLVVDPITEQPKYHYGSASTHPPKGLNAPYGMCLDHEGNVVVADNGNARLVVYKPNGDLIRVFGEGATLLNPMSVAVNADGLFFTCSWSSSQVFVFGANGDFLRKFETPLEFNYRLKTCFGVVASGRNIVVSTSIEGDLLGDGSVKKDGRLFEFTPEGQIIQEIEPEASRPPEDMFEPLHFIMLMIKGWCLLLEQTENLRIGFIC